NAHKQPRLCYTEKKAGFPKESKKRRTLNCLLTPGGVALYCFTEESGAPAPPAVKNEQEVLKMTKFAKRFLSAAAGPACCAGASCRRPPPKRRKKPASSSMRRPNRSVQ